MNTLVQFAGDDQRPRRRKAHGKPSAYALFLMGLDTFEIAKRLGIHEAEASKQVYLQRCREKGLPVETERRSS
ncbi:hypothetical protein ACFPLB_04165 [Aquamicrobium segne]|uniref:Uncharacterized protein n=1 Tax=Aquamicrobium segne TaxID=469547 RepID=A0ABW0GVN4_9HYPH